MGKLKIGDRVLICKCSSSLFREANFVRKIGTIIDIIDDQYPYHVKLDNIKHVELYYYEEELILVSNEKVVKLLYE